jgi:hypothetical protein
MITRLKPKKVEPAISCKLDGKHGSTIFVSSNFDQSDSGNVDEAIRMYKENNEVGYIYISIKDGYKAQSLSLNKDSVLELIETLQGLVDTVTNAK